jgi:hypothetical protein
VVCQPVPRGRPISIPHQAIRGLESNKCTSVSSANSHSTKSSMVMLSTCELKQEIDDELIAYFSLMRHGPHRKHQQFVVAARTFLLSCYLTTKQGYTDRPTDSPFIRLGPHGKLLFLHTTTISSIMKLFILALLTMLQLYIH